MLRRRCCIGLVSHLGLEGAGQRGGSERLKKKMKKKIMEIFIYREIKVRG